MLSSGTYAPCAGRLVDPGGLNRGSELQSEQGPHPPAFIIQQLLTAHRLCARAICVSYHARDKTATKTFPCR